MFEQVKGWRFVSFSRLQMMHMLVGYILGFRSCSFDRVGSSSVQVFILKDLSEQSVALVMVLVILLGDRDVNVRGQLISRLFFLFSHSVFRLCVLHLLAHLFLAMVLVSMLMGVSVGLLSHWCIILIVLICSALVVMLSLFRSKGLVLANWSANSLPIIPECPFTLWNLI